MRCRVLALEGDQPGRVALLDGLMGFHVGQHFHAFAFGDEAQRGLDFFPVIGGDRIAEGYDLPMEIAHPAGLSPIPRKAFGPISRPLEILKDMPEVFGWELAVGWRGRGWADGRLGDGRFSGAEHADEEREDE